MSNFLPARSKASAVQVLPCSAASVRGARAGVAARHLVDPGGDGDEVGGDCLESAAVVKAHLQAAVWAAAQPFHLAGHEIRPGEARPVEGTAVPLNESRRSRRHRARRCRTPPSCT